MYNLKLILESILEHSNGVGAPAFIPQIRTATQKAIAEVERLEQAEKDAPQEMRDLYAAASLYALADIFALKGTPNNTVATLAWNLSDAMMIERAKRIEARKAVEK